MEKEIFKMIQVDQECHALCKEMAKKRGMMLRGYIKLLAKEDKKHYEKNIKIDIIA